MMQWFTNAHQLCQPNALHMVQDCLQSNDLDHAISILNSLIWDTESKQCVACLNAICNHLLRVELTPSTEGKHV